MGNGNRERISLHFSDWRKVLAAATTDFKLLALS
jgi:hypothetical protein